MLRTKGPRAVVLRAWETIWTLTKIFAKGRNKTILIENCAFQLRGLSNSPMKLELQDGGYEQAELSAVRRYLDPECAVIELGACIGVVACVTNKRLRNPAAHVVLEMNPLVIPHLQSNRDANGCHFTILNRAIAYDTDAVTFKPSSNPLGSTLNQDGDVQQVTVETIRLANIVHDYQFTRFALICDIEGHEYQLLEHEPDIVAAAETIIMETHARIIGEDKIAALLRTLQDMGFAIVDTTGFVVTLTKTAVLPAGSAVAESMA